MIPARPGAALLVPVPLELMQALAVRQAFRLHELATLTSYPHPSRVGYSYDGFGGNYGGGYSYRSYGRRTGRSFENVSNKMMGRVD